MTSGATKGTLRAALYARVSTEEQVEGYSLDAQRRAFRALAQGRRWHVYHEYVEKGKSAHTEDTRKRPVFRQAIEDAISHKYDVLVVHRIDRFSRKVRVTLENFERLGKADVGFVSIQNEMDYTTPEGKLMLIMQGGLAEYYSDNLSAETKKGMAERKAQGLHLGSLPFGATSSSEGLAVPDPSNYPGLTLAFELGAKGHTDAEVAQALNARGYRTAGTRGGNPFANDSVRGLLRNRFYLGYLPDGKGDWIKGKHKPFISEELWTRVQEARKRRGTTTAASRPYGRRTWSLTGLTMCWYCQGRVHVHYVEKGEPRLGCYRRHRGWGCPQKSAKLSVYEAQVLEYLRTFHIPEDYRERILEYHRKLEAAYDDAEKERTAMEGRLKRLRELYEWNDITRSEYQSRKSEIARRIDVLAPTLRGTEHLDKLAQFLADVPAAWQAAIPEQRNKLARALFDQVWVKDQEVVAVKPRPQLQPFFRLNHERAVKVDMERSAPRRAELALKHGSTLLLAA